MSRLFITKIAQATAAERLTQSDREHISQLRSAKRRTEVTAWRSLLRHSLIEMGREAEAKAEILYNQIGAPYLSGCELHIGVSHSSTHVAVVVSDTICGVDIEQIDRNFERVASRYVTHSEHLLQSPQPSTPLLPLLWSAKETLYKVSGEVGLDLLTDLRVTEISPTTITGYIKKQRVVMHYTLQSNHIIVYTA